MIEVITVITSEDADCQNTSEQGFEAALAFIGELDWVREHVNVLDSLSGPLVTFRD